MGQCDFETMKSDAVATVNACSAVLADKTLGPEQRGQALKMRGRALRFQSHVDYAIKDFDEALKLMPNDPELLEHRGLAAFDQKNYAYAAELANRVIRENPNYAGGYDLLAVIKIQKKEDFAGAKKALDTAIKLGPADGIKYLQRFWLNYNWGLYPEALAALEDALRAPGDVLDWQVATLVNRIEVPKRVEVIIRHAWLLGEMGRDDDAMRDFGGFVQQNPGFISYSFRAAFAFSRHNVKQAQADIDAGYTYKPDFWFLNQTQGRIYLREKKYDQALTIFTHLMTQVPPSGQDYWWRSNAWRGLNKNEEAILDALIAMTDVDFVTVKLPELTELGYYQPPSPGNELAAVKDALAACFLDDRCN
jgi:tetratricopeptide (TPR) repeat protein